MEYYFVRVRRIQNAFNPKPPGCFLNPKSEAPSPRLNLRPKPRKTEIVKVRGLPFGDQGFRIWALGFRGLGLGFGF